MSDNAPRPRRLLNAIALFIADAWIDVAAFAGASSITFGARQIYEPAGFIVGGLFLLTGAWLAARRTGAQ